MVGVLTCEIDLWQLNDMSCITQYIYINRKGSRKFQCLVISITSPVQKNVQSWDV